MKAYKLLYFGKCYLNIIKEKIGAMI